MYKDLIELRHNRWIARREENKAKTLDEIKKDFEREEQLQAQQSQNKSFRSGNAGGRVSDRGNVRTRGDYRGDMRKDNSFYGEGNSKSKTHSKVVKTDEEGFTEVVGRNLQPKSNYMPYTTKPSAVTRPSSTVKAPPPPVITSVKIAPLSKEKLEIKAKNMRLEYMQDPSNTEELLLTMDELAGTPEAGEKVVQINVDHAIDCKDDERKAVISMLEVLYTNGKLEKSHFEVPMGDIVEFISSFVVDSPNAYQYLGDMLTTFIHMNALSVLWLCEQCEKLKAEDSDAIEEVLRKAIESQKRIYGLDEAMTTFGNVSHKAALVGAVGADKWSQIAIVHSMHSCE